MWDRFSSAETSRRFGLARDLMREHDLQALVLFGNSGVSRGNMANAFWLSNHLDLHHCYVVVPLDESQETALYAGLTNHVPNAREVSEIPVIEWGGYNPAEKVVARLRSLGLERGRVGLVGVNAKFSMGMPYAHHEHLRRELRELDPVDVTGQYQRLRAIKSEEEVEWLRKAAALTDQGMRALAEGARPGMTDVELVALAESAYRPEGGIPRIMFLRSMPMDAPNGCLPAQNPSRRCIERGDVIITEFSASYWGYTGQIQRPVFVGAEPTAEWRRMLDVAKEAFDAIVGAMHAGSTEAEVLAAAEPIRDAGYLIYDDLVHGYGVDIMPPIVDREQFAHPPEGAGATFEANMAVVVQPNPITPDERAGLQLGELTIVREGGAESLHSLPFEPLVAG